MKKSMPTCLWEIAVTELYDWFKHQLLTNEVFAGVAGGSIFMSMLYTLRDAPRYVIRFVLWHLTVQMQVRNNCEGFAWISLWLYRHPYLRKARRIRLLEYEYHDEDGNRRHGSAVGIGEGWHFLSERGKWIAIRRIQEEEKTLGTEVREMYEIYCFGRDQRILTGIAERSRSAARHRKVIPLHVYDSGWCLVGERSLRDLSTIVMDHQEKQHLTHDLSTFMENEAWYVERGIPWRRGYLFYGPPGCGKTSLVMALASLHKVQLCVLAMGALNGDDDLVSAFQFLPKNSILVMEDIDAVQRHRQPIVKKKGDDDKEESSPLTLSTLLNVLDGLLSREGQIVMMTTNYPERIDPALLRPGRVDVKMELPLLSNELVQQMFLRFFPNSLEHFTVEGIPASTIQGICLTHRHDERQAAKEINALNQTPALVPVSSAAL